MRGLKGTFSSEFILVFINLYIIVFGHDLKGFDDTVLFKINWPGQSSTELLVRLATLILSLKHIL